MKILPKKHGVGPPHFHGAIYVPHIELAANVRLVLIHAIEIDSQAIIKYLTLSDSLMPRLSFLKNLMQVSLPNLPGFGSLFSCDIFLI